MKVGIQVGKHFMGYKSSAQLVSRPEGFTENREEGMTYVVASGDIKDVLNSLRGAYTDRTLVNLYGCVAEIFAPIHAIASRVVSAIFELRRIKDDEVVYDNAYINKLLEQPNILQNFKQLLYEAVTYEYVTGKTFVFNNTPSTLSKDYKNISSCSVLPSDEITIETHERIKLFTATLMSDVVKSYILEKGTRNETSFGVEDVLYRRAINLNWDSKKIEGRSPLLSAEKAIANLIAVYKARNVVYVKRGAMGYWVSRKSDNSGMVALNEKEKKAARKELNEGMGLDGRKDTVGLTSAPIDFVKSSMSIQELMPFEETSADAAAIYGVLNVPYELAPKPKGETFSNQLTAERSFYQNTVIPLADSWMQSLSNEWGLRKWGYYLHANFSHIEVLQENKKENSDVFSNNVESYTKLYKDGGITYNEWLIGMGFEARGVEFDKYISDLQDVPMAVKIGVGGTQAMQSVIADPNLSEDAKANLLVLLFGVTIEQARVVVVTAPKPITTNEQP